MVKIAETNDKPADYSQNVMNVVSVLYDSQQGALGPLVRQSLGQFKEGLEETRAKRTLEFCIDVLLAARGLEKVVDDPEVLTQIWEEIRTLKDGYKRAEYDAETDRLRDAVEEDKNYVSEAEQAMLDGIEYNVNEYDKRTASLQERAAALREHLAQPTLPAELEELADQVQGALNYGKNYTLVYKGNGTYEIDGKIEISVNEVYDPNELRKILLGVDPFFKDNSSVQKLIKGKTLKTKGKEITGQSVMDYFFLMQNYSHLSLDKGKIAKRLGVAANRVNEYAREGRIETTNLGGAKGYAVHVYRTSYLDRMIQTIQERLWKRNKGGDDLERKVAGPPRKGKSTPRAGGEPSADGTIRPTIQTIIDLGATYSGQLTGRDKELYGVVVKYPTLSNCEIAEKMGITLGNVSKLVSQTAKKLGQIRDQSEAGGDLEGKVGKGSGKGRKPKPTPPAAGKPSGDGIAKERANLREIVELGSRYMGQLTGRQKELVNIAKKDLTVNNEELARGLRISKGNLSYIITTTHQKLKELVTADTSPPPASQGEGYKTKKGKTGSKKGGARTPKTRDAYAPRPPSPDLDAVVGDAGNEPAEPEFPDVAEGLGVDDDSNGGEDYAGGDGNRDYGAEGSGVSDRVERFMASTGRGRPNRKKVSGGGSSSGSGATSIGNLKEFDPTKDYKVGTRLNFPGRGPGKVVEITGELVRAEIFGSVKGFQRK